MPTDLPNEELRQLLLDRRNEIESDWDRQQEALEGIRGARAESVDDEHDPEGPTLSSEWSRAFGIVSALGLERSEIEAALERLDDGTYGVCETCGNPIAVDRLLARPTARQCVACASNGR